MKKTNLIFIAIMLVVVSAFALTSYPIYTESASLIQAGQGVSTSDGTVTNTFTIAYSSRPKVTVTPFNTAMTTTNHITVVTESNFVWKTGATGVTNFWIAVGAP